VCVCVRVCVCACVWWVCMVVLLSRRLGGEGRGEPPLLSRRYPLSSVDFTSNLSLSLSTHGCPPPCPPNIHQHHLERPLQRLPFSPHNRKQHALLHTVQPELQLSLGSNVKSRSLQVQRIRKECVKNAQSLLSCTRAFSRAPSLSSSSSLHPLLSFSFF
jgi:hypothetical protein